MSRKNTTQAEKETVGNPMIDTTHQDIYHNTKEGGISVIIVSHAHYNNNAYKNTFCYLTLANDGGNVYNGWKKNLKSAMISGSAGFRPVSFHLEAPNEEAEG